MANRYWIGNGSNTAWSTNSNWSTTSGGIADTVAPTSVDDVYFNAGGSGDCIISSTVSVNTFDVATNFYTGTITDGGNTIHVDHNLAIYGSPDAIDRTNSTGTWKVYKSGWCSVARLSAYIYRLIIGSGAVIDNNPITSRAAGYGTWCFAQKIIMESGSSFANTTLCPIYTFENDPLDIHPNATIYSSTTIRYYYPGDLYPYQKGFTTLGDIQINYGDSDTIIQTGTVNCRNLTIHRGGGMTPEANSNKWFVGGSQLNVSQNLNLGLSSIYGQYTGSLWCGSGIVRVDGNLTVGWPLSSGWLHLENGTIYIGGNLRLNQVDVFNSGNSTIVMSGSNLQAVWGDNKFIKNFKVDKLSSIVITSGNFRCNNFELARGNFNLEGRTVGVSGSLITTGGRFWNGSNASMSSGWFDTTGNITLSGTSNNLLQIRDLNFSFNSPAYGTADYCTVQNSSYSGNSFMDARYRATWNNGGNSGWMFTDLYFPVQLPNGTFFFKKPNT